jgi:hypothetical protein
MGIPSWDARKFEMNLSREIAQRRDFLYTEDSADSFAASGTSPFDQFLVVGPTSDCNFGILAAFPPFELADTNTTQIIDYCLPTGHLRRDLNRRSRKFVQDEFVFRLHTTSRFLYGVCVHVGRTDSLKIPFFRGSMAAKSVICFCLLTSRPTFSSHFSFLVHLAFLSVGHASPIGFQSDFPVVLETGRPIQGLNFETQIGQHPLVRFSNEVVDEVLWYYHCPMDTAPVSFDHELFLTFPPPSVPWGDMIMWASLDTLFSLLAPHEVLAILGAILLDGQVLVIGNLLQEISMTVFALVSLISPFEFSGIVIPILPNTEVCLTLLNSPTPFLIGCIRSSAIARFAFMETTVFVELDSRRKVPQSIAFPKFPQIVHIGNQIKAFLKSHSIGAHPFGFPTDVTRDLGHKVSFKEGIPEQILEIVQIPFGHIFSDAFVCFFVTDLSAHDHGITVFNKELFIAMVSAADVPFFEALMGSMTFQLYLEKRINDFSRGRGLVLELKQTEVAGNFLAPRKKTKWVTPRPRPSLSD